MYNQGPPWQPQYPPPPPPPQTVVYVAAPVVHVPFKHGVHIVFDVLTCGAWLPFHLICWACH